MTTTTTTRYEITTTDGTVINGSSLTETEDGYWVKTLGLGPGGAVFVWFGDVAGADAITVEA